MNKKQREREQNWRQGGRKIMKRARKTRRCEANVSSGVAEGQNPLGIEDNQTHTHTQY